MIIAAAYLWIYPGGETEVDKELNENISAESTKIIVDSEGIRYSCSYNRPLGIGLSIFVGYISSLLGVGGGFIHVPILVPVLIFPVHIATATSHFILSIMALTGTLVHVVIGRGPGLCGIRILIMAV